ncbi:hypothetical protein HKX48_008146, partial [Thoreauomyces humboldtii]
MRAAEHVTLGLYGMQFYLYISSRRGVLLHLKDLPKRPDVAIAPVHSAAQPVNNPMHPDRLKALGLLTDPLPTAKTTPVTVRTAPLSQSAPPADQAEQPKTSGIVNRLGPRVGASEPPVGLELKRKREELEGDRLGRQNSQRLRTDAAPRVSPGNTNPERFRNDIPRFFIVMPFVELYERSELLNCYGTKDDLKHRLSEAYKSAPDVYLLFCVKSTHS